MSRRQELLRAVLTEGQNLAAARARLASAQRWLDLTGDGLNAVVTATAIEKGVFSRWLRASEAFVNYR